MPAPTSLLIRERFVVESEAQLRRPLTRLAAKSRSGGYVFTSGHAHRGFRINDPGMPTKKQARRKVPSLIAAIVLPVSTRLSHMEDLLIEMRGEYDVNLKKINKLQAQLDTLTDIVSRRSRGELH